MGTASRHQRTFAAGWAGEVRGFPQGDDLDPSLGDSARSISVTKGDGFARSQTR